MNILTLDFETYYSREFSLTKVTTEEYIRDAQFEVIGVSVQVNDGQPVWRSGSSHDLHQFLGRFDWANSLALAHNAMFDGAILHWVYGLSPKGWLDTLSMGRALHGTEVGGSLKALAAHYGVGVKGIEVDNALGMRRQDFGPEQLRRYGEYCMNDTSITYALFKAMVVDFPPIELRLIDLTVRMFTEPVLQLNKSLLEDHLSRVKSHKQTMLGQYSRDDLMSNPKFAELLKFVGVEPPMKISPTTGKQTYAFAKSDDEFVGLLEHENEMVQALVAARLGTKSTLEETRTNRFIGIAERGALPVPLRYYAAHTGRWGGDDKLNLQNLPRASALKNAIIAPLGYVILDSDSSQIEARTLAWLAGQDNLVDAFERGEDVYMKMASAIYGKAADQVTKAERFVGKTTILGCGYGMGAIKFRDSLKNAKPNPIDITPNEAKRIIDTYRAQNPNIVELWKNAGSALKAMLENQQTTLGRNELLMVEGLGGIRLPNGLRLKYPNIRLQDNEEGKTEVVYDIRRGKQTLASRLYGGKVIENCCQALARIVIGEQMLLVAKKYRVVMTVHDAVACIAPKAEASTAKEYIELCMRIRPKWATDLPLNCEAGYGDSYGDC